MINFFALTISEMGVSKIELVVITTNSILLTPISLIVNAKKLIIIFFE